MKAEATIRRLHRAIAIGFLVLVPIAFFVPPALQIPTYATVGALLATLALSGLYMLVAPPLRRMRARGRSPDA